MSADLDSGLDETIGAPAVAADYPEMVPVDPAHYVLSDEIARGGMGRIRIARDRRLGRRIAIKEILVNRADVARRFEREARITARLEHPAIVSIHEAGAWPTGEPFIAMRLVSGRSLDEVIAGATTLVERIALVPNVLAVADAMAYAHEQGVIHRDLKPKNVLVGKFGETVVIDWGLAKDTTLPDEDSVSMDPATPGVAAPLTGTEETLGSEPPMPGSEALTVDGAVMGTPAYMPPEQARGQRVDARADVYAIGALLYHVLAGRPPITGKTLAIALEEAIAGQFDRLEHLVPDAPAELVAIVDKAMQLEPDARYANAGELAADLRRFQTGQLVGAHRYSTAELFAKWLRRHRTAVVTSAIALVVLAIVAVISVRRIIAEREHAEAQERLADVARIEAETLVDFMLGDLKDQLAPLGRLALLDAVTARAMAYYEGRPPGLPEGEAKRARAFTSRATVLEAQGNLAGALDLTRKVLAIRKALPVTSEGQGELAAAYRKLAEILKGQGDTAGALAAAREAIAVAEAGGLVRDQALGHERVASALAKDDPKGSLAEYRAALALRQQLAKAAPDNLAAQRDVAIGHERIGRLIFKDDPAGALVELRIALAISEELAPKEPGNKDRRRDLAVLRTRIGDALLVQQDLAGATSSYRQAKLINDELLASEPANLKYLRDVSISHGKLGDALAPSDPGAALVEYRAALQIAVRLAAQDPRNVEWARDVAISHETVAAVLLDVKDAAGAVVEYRASRDILAKLAEQDPSNMRWKTDLADTLAKLADAEAAAK